MNAIRFEYDDGGRDDAGRKPSDDCVVRAICVATGRDYMATYDAMHGLSKEYRAKRLARGKKAPTAAPRTGVLRSVYEPYLLNVLGWAWKPTMAIGSGCKVHLRADELPGDCSLIVAVSRHMTAVVDGVLRDTHDCSRGGTRCVYGYYYNPNEES